MRKEIYTLIILEDEPAHAEAIRRYLSAPECRFNIITVSSLKEFHEAALVNRPDLVIADINLPDGTAFSLLGGDIEDQLWPVLIMTSYGDEEIAVRAIKSGALDYIVKSPDTFNNIAHVVTRNLREWGNIVKRRESERNFRTLFETMDQGVIYHDVNGKITAANSAAERITGLTLAQMQNRSIFDPRQWAAIHEDGSVWNPETFPAVLSMSSGIPVTEQVMGLLNQEKNSYTWVLVSAVPQFRDNETTPFQVFTTLTDITDLKHTEIELIKSKEKAEESDRLKSIFMANMSHEIRTPMNGILGFADLLRTTDLSGESQKRYIEAINTSGRRMLGIINDLIDISKIEAGQVEIRKDKTNIVLILNELMLFFTPESEKKGIDLRLKVSLPSDFIIQTDRTKLTQVLTNLLNNSLKFTKQGGTTELGCRLQENKALLFSVKDTGTGIRKELQNKIFERFRQGDGSEEHEGIGLGLAISKAYVEMMGGTIWLESEPGKGSNFFFTIPFDEPVELPAQEPAEKAEESDEIPSMNVLVAEDDDLNFALLKEILRKPEIKLFRASTGEEAISLVRNNPEINLVLMDIKLPSMDGMEASKEIKKMRPDLPIIAQSAYVSETDIQKSFEAGIDDYITKPINIKLLLQKVSSYSKALNI